MHRLLPRIAAPRPSSRLRPSCSHAPARRAAPSPSHAPLAHCAAPLRGARRSHAPARGALRYTPGEGARSQSSLPRGLLVALPISRALVRSRCAAARRTSPRISVRAVSRRDACAACFCSQCAARASARCRRDSPIRSRTPRAVPRLALGLQLALSSWSAAQAPPPWGATASRRVQRHRSSRAPCVLVLTRATHRPAAWGPKTSRTPSGKRWAMAQRRSVWGRTPSRTLTLARCACSPCRCALRLLLRCAHRCALAHASTAQRQRGAASTLAPLFHPLADSLRARPRRRTR